MMGIATIMILLGHVIFYSNGIVSFGIFNELITLGYSGVDVFLLLSGFGLVYSIQENTRKQFYKRRFLRIFPALIGVVVLYCLFHYKKLGFYLLNPLFWYNGYWFLGFIIIAYLIFPYLYSFIKASTSKKIWSIIGLICIFTIAIMTKFNIALNCNPYMCFIGRIPIFCIGVCIAMNKYPYLENKWYQLTTLITGLLLLLPFYFLNDLGGNTVYTTYYHFIFITPPFVIFCCKILSKCGENTYIILNMIGKYSLDIYLVQVTIMPFLIAKAMAHSSNATIIFTTGVIPTILLSLFFHYFIEKLSIYIKKYIYL